MAQNASQNTYFTKKRYGAFLFFTLFSLIIPFIKIGGNHFFLLSFERKQLHLLFNTFAAQELFLMPFIVMFFFIFIFFITTLGGRVWCGWGCPQTIFRTIYRDLIQTKILGIRKSIDNKQKENEKGFRYVLGMVILACLCFLAAANLLWFFIPPEDFFSYIKTPAEHPFVIIFVLALGLFLFFLVAFLEEKFCIYVCPYARVQSVMFDDDTVQVIYDEVRGGKVYDGHEKLGRKPKEEGAECVGCEACVRVCPTHIDIRQGMQLECINCLECADACSHTMDKLGKKSLISWASKNSIDTREKIKFFRFRTVGYIVVLGIVAAVLGYMTTKKENMLLNINRDSELYTIEVNDGKVEVENDYVFLIENTDSNDHAYYFEFDSDDFEIVKPKSAVKVRAGQKHKTVVILKAKKEMLGNDASKDNVMPLVIHAYAEDAKDTIHIDRKTIFIYPSADEIKKAQ